MKTADNNASGGFPFQIDEFYRDLQEDGSKVSILSQEEITRRPFPGLRPFKTSEFQLFNGRVGQAEELIKRLKKNRFLAVIGSSGTGKSSLVRAGLIPQLFGGYLHGAGSKWNIAICRPGKDPVENLAIALSSIKTHTKNPKELVDNFYEIEPQLTNSIYGLLDVKQVLEEDRLAKNPDQPPSNLLVIIDQFEELFRFERKDLGKENIENQFVNLLLKASLDPGNSVYVIITMRSEFLGDCVRYRGLPEAINEGQYLVPQLTRNELKEVIENPIKLAGKKIDTSLVELLVNEIEESRLKENLDQLPILQHALMRTYNEAMLHGPDTEICREHYEKIGEMEKALANHAEAKFNELADAGSNVKNLSKKQQLAKIIFQTLTELGAGLKGGRRPTELKNIYTISASQHTDEKEVDDVVNHFRESDTSFIMPPINTVLYPNLIVDISHESLMRNWARLTEWMTEEMKYGSLYRRLNERRLLHEDDNEEWLRGVLLRELLEWKDTYANNPAWASRYHQFSKNINDPAFHESLYKKNIAFLNESLAITEKIKEEEKKELEEKFANEQKIQSAKTRARVLAIATLISLLFGVWAFAERYNARKQEEIAKEQRMFAEQNAKRADSLKIKALGSAEEAKRNADTASVQRIIAEKQKKIADSIATIAIAQRKELAIYATIAEQQKNKALELSKIAENKKADFETQLVKNALKDQDFYFSNYLDQATKEEIIDSLYTAPLFNSAQINLHRYVDTGLLRLINDAVLAKENVTENPAANLEIARQLWKASQRPVLRNLLLSIVNDNIFPESSVELAGFIDLKNARLSFSDKNAGFALSNGSQLVTGKNQNGKLVINENSFDDGFDRFFCGLKDSVTSLKNIAYLNYGDSNRITALIDSFRLSLNSDGKITRIDTIPRFMNVLIHDDPRVLKPALTNYLAIKLSPGGESAFILDNNENILLERFAGKNSDKKIDSFGNYRNKELGTESMCFSADGQYKLINGAGKLKVIGKNNKVIMTSVWDIEDISAAAFTPDSKSIITVTDGKIFVRDTLLNESPNLTEINLKDPYLQSSVNTDDIHAVSISKNWKKVLIAQKNGKSFLIEKKNGDSLFIKKEDDEDRGLRVKEIGNSRDRTRAEFYNDSTIFAINDQGILSLWPIYPDFENPDSAIAAVFPKTTFRDKLYDDSISFPEILASDDAIELNTAAYYYYKYKKQIYPQEKIDTAKMIYKKLLDRAPAEMRIHYLNRLFVLNKELTAVAKIDFSSAPNRGQLLAINKYRQTRVRRLKESIDILTEQQKVCPNNSDYKKELSDTYGSLSFSQLFTNDFEGALLSARKGLSYKIEKNDWINTNLALSYLLTERFREAEEKYLLYNGKFFKDGRMSFKQAFLEDLQALEEAGIFDNASDLVRDEKEKIKTMLASTTVTPTRRGRMRF